MNLVRVGTGSEYVLGEGKHGIVYHVDDGYALKVLKPHVNPSVLIREFWVTSALHGKGYPVAKPYGPREVKLLGSEGTKERKATGLLFSILPGVNIKRDILLRDGNRELHDALENRVFDLALRAQGEGFNPVDEGTQNAHYDPVSDRVFLLDFAGWGLPNEIPNPEGSFSQNDIIELK